MHSSTDRPDRTWRCHPRSPSRLRRLVTMKLWFPRPRSLMHRLNRQAGGYTVAVPSHPAISRRWATTLRWPFGIALTGWSYMWRTTPMYRRELAGSLACDAPPPLPQAADTGRVQRWETGHGVLYHRRYAVRIRDADLSAELLMARLKRDPNHAAPSAFATFHKTRGDEGTMRVGDEYVVRMPGPWDGPVRVVEVDSRSYRLATLESHLEAGQIRTCATDDGP